MITLAVLGSSLAVVSMAYRAGASDSRLEMTAVEPSPVYVLYDSFSYQKAALWEKSSGTGSGGTTYLRENVKFSNGKLILKSSVDSHRGGEYISTKTYWYGKYQASIRLIQAPGSVVGFATYKGPEPSGHNEIDMKFSEENGKSYLEMATWYHGSKTAYRYALPFDPGAAYHTYGFNWQGDRVDFFIDDMTKPVWSSTSNIPREASYLLFNNWVLRNPPADHGNGITTAYVNWVSVSKPVSQPTVTPTPTVTPAPTPKPTVTPTVTPSPTPRPTVTPTATPTVTPVPTPRPTVTPTPVPQYTLYDDLNSQRSDIWRISSSGGAQGTRYVPQYVTFSNGKLVLKSTVDNHQGGEYCSVSRYFYGMYQASIRVEQTPGTTTSFYTYKGPEPTGHNEIDIEFIKQSDGSTTVYFITWLHGAKTGKSFRLPFDPGAAYHTYGFNWQRDHVDFFIDDMTRPMWTSYSNIPNEASYLLFSNWVFSSPPPHGDGINYEYVDWVSFKSN